MQKISKLVGALVMGAMLLTGTTVALAAHDDDQPLTGQTLELASEAALEFVGEGVVTETEVGDEEGAYEVEITKSNGEEVDVHLDENFNVIGSEVETCDDDEDEMEDAHDDDDNDDEECEDESGVSSNNDNDRETMIRELIMKLLAYLRSN